MSRNTSFIPIILAAILGLHVQARTPIAMSYNTENLFDCQHDTLKQDSDFLPTSYKHWTYTRFKKKLNRIATVIANASEWQTIPIIGLLEVENDLCIQALLKQHLKNFGYQYLHRESHDIRGIDCVLLYDPKQFRLLDYDFYAITNDNRDTIGRDIVYAKGLYLNTDTMYIFLCHLPSRRGQSQADIQREKNIALIQTKLAQLPKNAYIIVMGDMNAAPAENLNGLHNLMLQMPKTKGTYCYQEKWEYIDQFYVSFELETKVTAEVFVRDWLLTTTEEGTLTPWRTFKGRRYLNGYSDHLPIILYTKETE